MMGKAHERLKRRLVKMREEERKRLLEDHGETLTRDVQAYLDRLGVDIDDRDATRHAFEEVLKIRARDAERGEEVVQGSARGKKALAQRKGKLRDMLITALKKLGRDYAGTYWDGERFLYDQACERLLGNIPPDVAHFLKELPRPGRPPNRDEQLLTDRTLKKHTKELKNWTRAECDQEFGADDPARQRYRAELARRAKGRSRPPD